MYGAGVVGAGAVAAGAYYAGHGYYGRQRAYAYYQNEYANNSGNSYDHISWDDYARRNGFVCRPGTWFKGDDGLQHICQ